VHHVVPAAELDAALARYLRELLTSAPVAAAQARALIEHVRGKPPAEVQASTTEMLARVRAGTEAREGVAAFLEKRAPAWVLKDES
jgi:methylglutaconyl-CoA hydratase